MNSNTLPEFVRLPKAGQRCPITQLSRTSMCELVVPSSANAFRPPVRSIVKKKHKYATRGIRLIIRDSLLDYLRSLSTDTVPSETPRLNSSNEKE